MPRPYRHVLLWGGLRGALALVLSLPLTLPNGSPFPNRSPLQGMAFGLVALSLLLQGLTMGPLLSWLGLVRTEEERGDAYETAQARLLANTAALDSLSGAHERGEIGDGDLGRLSAGYRRQHEQLLGKVQSLQQGSLGSRADVDRHAARRAAMAEGAALRRLYRTVAVSQETVQGLEREIDDRLAGSDK